MARIWVLGSAIAATVAACIVVCVVFMHKAGADRVIYALDDPYIHMAMAKNLVASGVYGVTSHEFTSSSSSPLWTLLIAGAYWLLGPGEIIPLAMNILAAMILLWAVYEIFRRCYKSNLGALVTLLLVAFMFPMIPMIFTGMEHVLHTALVLLLLWRCGKWLEGGRKGLSLDCIALAMLATATRYESAFVIAAVALVFVLHRRYLAAAILLAAGALPPVVYGLVSMSHGSYFLPNSLVLKGHPPWSLGIGYMIEYLSKGVMRLEKSHHLLVLIVACCAMALLRWRRGPLAPTQRLFLAVFLLVTPVHLQLANVGWFYRYEAYLVALGLVTFLVVGSEELHLAWGWIKGLRWPSQLVLAGMIMVLSWPLCLRGQLSLTTTPTAMTNIYQQQYQMGRFFEQYPANRSVAAHDIGAICWLADLNLLDLYGLGTVDVARASLKGALGTQYTREQAARRGIEVAVVYNSWFTEKERLPAEWIPLAAWQTADHVVGSDTVTFYAVSPQRATALGKDLREFAKSLPPQVQVIWLDGLPR